MTTATIINDPSQFSPYMYISIGWTGAYYTLWGTRMEVVGTRFGNEYVMRRDYYCNLSQDASEAYAKAVAYSQNMGMELRSTEDSIRTEMREIQRATAEQLKEREEKLRLKNEESLAIAEFIRNQQLDLIKNGKYPIGHYYGKEFSSAPESYVTWLVNNREQFEVDSIIRLTADAVSVACADLVLPTPDHDMTIGTIGKRESFDVTVIRKTGYYSTFGWTNVVTMVDKSGACIVSKGSFYSEVGDKITIKGTVKNYDRYNDQMQTQIQRVSFVGYRG